MKINPFCYRFSEDHWNLYLDYITSVFRLTDAGNAEISTETALQFIHEQQNKFPKNRGPFLAEIELQTRMLARAGSSEDLERQLGQLMIDYFERFSSKPACGLDLKLYLPSVGRTETNKFFDETFKLIDLDEKQVPKTVKTF